MVSSKSEKTTMPVGDSSERPSGYSTIESSHNGLRPEIVVDLRSDTLTKPNAGMRQAIANAVVGDDVFGEDPTITELETRLAKIFNKESGLFVTSGSMGNLLAILCHCNERGSEMIVGDKSHVFCFEQGSSAQFGGVHSCQIKTKDDGTFDTQEIIDRIRFEDIHFPKTKLICVENTSNRCGGRALPLSFLDQIGEIARKYKIATHMDGARVFNAAIATGVPVSRIVRDFDSVSVCLSKGLGAPIGSVLMGSTEFIKQARRLRKPLGGGMRQAGILGAAGLYCIDNMISRLQEDHDNAKLMAKIINEMRNPQVFIKYDELETNIIMLTLLDIPVERFLKKMVAVEKEEKEQIGSLVSVKAFPDPPNRIRLVTHADVSQEEVALAAKKICYVAQDIGRSKQNIK